MKPPYLLTRVTGEPFVALVLLGLFGAVIFGWSRGHVPMFLAVIAGLFSIATANSAIEVRHYHRWMAAFESMGQPEGETLKRKRSWLSIALAVGLFIFIPTRQLPTDAILLDVYVITWSLSVIYLAFSLFTFLLARNPHVKKVKAPKKEEVATVDYAISRASSSPSFEDATRNLPDYAAAMLRDKGQ